MAFKEDKDILIEYMNNHEIFDHDDTHELEKFFEFIDDLEQKAADEVQYFSLLSDAYMLIGYNSKAKDAFEKVYNPKNKKDIRKLIGYDSASAKIIVRPDKRAKTLPAFKYVDKNMLKNKFIMSDNCMCSICKKSFVPLYVGTVYKNFSQKIFFINEEERFCAYCLSDGTAAKKLDLKFNSSMIEECIAFDVEKREELLYKTPACSDNFDFNEEIWPSCCGDFCCYTGYEYIYEEVYYFRCIHCGKKIKWIKNT